MRESLTHAGPVSNMLDSLTHGESTERRLNDGSVLALRNVACDFQDGVLTLRGCLPTYYLKQLAQAHVSDLAGVRQVINELEVSAPRRQPAWR